jgi:hypothetical protein
MSALSEMFQLQGSNESKRFCSSIVCTSAGHRRRLQVPTWILIDFSLNHLGWGRYEMNLAWEMLLSYRNVAINSSEKTSSKLYTVFIAAELMALPTAKSKTPLNPRVLGHVRWSTLNTKTASGHPPGLGTPNFGISSHPIH